ncbi:MAG: outer membrane lipid asymmetry maintenance protein MlaD [Desulfobacterales bacterium]|nr:outer membrane lipid asymmetry maintenance protein MlaD [Desulfobacterales bacterium]
MKKYAMETVVGVFVLVGLLGIAYMTVNFAEVSFWGDKGYSLTAKFNTITGLKTGASVEMLGMKIGRVERFVMDQKNQQAAVVLDIDKGIIVYDDAIASIKTRGLIGDRYVSIDPGGAGDRLEPGGVITETESPVDIEELISKYAFGDVESK